MKKISLDRGKHYIVTKPGVQLTSPLGDGSLTRMSLPVGSIFVVRNIFHKMGTGYVIQDLKTKKVGILAVPTWQQYESFVKDWTRTSSLKARIIRLAHAKPALRQHLLPLLKQATPPQSVLKRPIHLRLHGGDMEVTSLMSIPMRGNYILQGWIKDIMGETSKITVEFKGNQFKQTTNPQGTMALNEVGDFLRANWLAILRALNPML